MQQSARRGIAGMTQIDMRPLHIHWIVIMWVLWLIFCAGMLVLGALVLYAGGSTQR
jgi:hypothetical protein